MDNQNQLIEKRVEIFQKSFKMESIEEKIRISKESIWNEERYRRLVEFFPEMIALHHKEKYVYVNPAGVKILRAAAQEELIGRSIFEFIHPDSIEAVKERIKQLEGGKDAPLLEEKFIQLDGTVVYMEVAATPIHYQGEVLIEVVARDITDRKRAEDGLRHSEEKYRTLVENANEAIFIVQDEKIKFLNQKALPLTGYTAQELSETPFKTLIHPDDRNMVVDRYKRRMKGERVPNVYSFRIINRREEEFWVQINSNAILWEGRPASLNFLRDITQEKKLEAQLRQAQKMEAIGTLAGGIAHDFNNLLMGIQGYASLMLFDIDASHPHYENLKMIEEQTRNGASLTSQLLGFARKGKYEVEPLDLNDVLQQSSILLERTKKEINISRRYQKEIWTVEANKGQMEQMLLNLYVNACQAMPGGGTLYLETKNITLGPDYIKPFHVRHGHYVKISVTDTGVGIDKEMQQRIFEPFFTTKEMGRGTGLGLASVYGIVKGHGGSINVYSEKGHGTTFTIYLPASDMEVKGKKDQAGTIFQGSETLLLVDDENVIINVVEKSLQLSGYKVLVARGGEEAVAIYRENADRIALVILDMIMPGTSGSKTYDLLKKTNPDIKVILSSGYSIDGEASQIIARGCNGFIQKPFGIKELSQKIREIMDNS